MSQHLIDGVVHTAALTGEAQARQRAAEVVAVNVTGAHWAGVEFDAETVTLTAGRGATMTEVDVVKVAPSCVDVAVTVYDPADW